MENRMLQTKILNLSADQKKHYDSISWLINPLGPRASGRTYLLALAFIEHALKTNIWVGIYNHDTRAYTINEIATTIEQIIKEVGLEQHFLIRGLTIHNAEIRIRRQKWQGE